MFVTYIGNKLCIRGTEVVFAKEIYKILEVDNGVFVLTHGVHTHELEERNVYFVNFDGSIKWQIQHLGESNSDIGYQGYISMKLDVDNNLEVKNYRGFSCKVDIETGKLIDCDYGNNLAYGPTS